MNARHERTRGWATSKFCEEAKKEGGGLAGAWPSSDGIERDASWFEQELVDKIRIFYK